MNYIFDFIFNCISGILKFLDFNLPGISLSFLDFILLSILVPLLFKFVKGSFDEFGYSSSVFDNVGDTISSYRTSQLNKFKLAKQNSYSTYRENAVRGVSYKDRLSQEAEESNYNFVNFGEKDNLHHLMTKYSRND